MLRFITITKKKILIYKLSWHWLFKQIKKHIKTIFNNLTIDNDNLDMIFICLINFYV